VVTLPAVFPLKSLGTTCKGREAGKLQISPLTENAGFLWHFDGFQKKFDPGFNFYMRIIDQQV
jgi:hypothetical protein